MPNSFGPPCSAFSPRAPRLCGVFFFFVASLFFLSQPAQAKWRYLRTGNPTDLAVQPRAGFALMGGGSKLEPAFRYLCEHANGGDFLILRAEIEDDYARKVNADIKALCPLNSVAPIIFNDRHEDSRGPQNPQINRKAQTNFLAAR